jgi:hypothetical protein
MEYAGLTRETMADSLTGVFVGLTHSDYQVLAADAHAVEQPYGFTGTNFSLASGRIAYALGFHGPALAVDTACSSGLTAVHLACRSLRERESDLALAGAYTAAKSWLDAFTGWRRAQGPPATAIAWGPWAQVGRATALAEGAGVAIAPGEGAYAFDALLRHDRGYTGYAPITGTPWLTAFAQRSPFAEAFRSVGHNPTGTSKLRAELDELPAEEWPTVLRRMISDQVSPDPAPQRRPRPPALRIRRGLAGRPRTTYPHRDRNRNTHHLHRTSPPFAVWRDCCAKSWPPRKPPDIDVSA